MSTAGIGESGILVADCGEIIFCFCRNRRRVLVRGGLCGFTDGDQPCSSVLGTFTSRNKPDCPRGTWDVFASNTAVLKLGDTARCLFPDLHLNWIAVRIAFICIALLSLGRDFWLVMRRRPIIIQQYPNLATPLRRPPVTPLCESGDTDDSAPVEEAAAVYRSPLDIILAKPGDITVESSDKPKHWPPARRFVHDVAPEHLV